MLQTQQSINSDTIQTNGNHFTATQTNANHFTATNTNHNTKFHLIPNLIDTYILLKEKYTNLFPNEMKQGCFDDGESVSDREWVPWLQPTAWSLIDYTNYPKKTSKENDVWFH